MALQLTMLVYNYFINFILFLELIQFLDKFIPYNNNRKANERGLLYTSQCYNSESCYTYTQYILHLFVPIDHKPLKEGSSMGITIFPTRKEFCM